MSLLGVGGGGGGGGGFRYSGTIKCISNSPKRAVSRVRIHT